MKDNDLPSRSVRCLSKEEAACYLGIGVTLLSEFDIPAVKFGRRLLYDKVDLLISVCPPHLASLMRFSLSTVCRACEITN